jgi:hypothetical protein
MCKFIMRMGSDSVKKHDVSRGFRLPSGAQLVKLGYYLMLGRLSVSAAASDLSLGLGK